MAENKSTVLIIAPHRDDELIGCYEMITKAEDVIIDILFLFSDNDWNVGITVDDFDNIRYMHNAMLIEPSNMKEWENVFDHIEKSCKKDYDHIAVPNISDNHISHKLVNIAVKTFVPLEKIMYYQVEMNVARPLSSASSGSKKHFLERYYARRYESLKSDKYHLFESMEASDHKRYIHCGFQLKGKHYWPGATGKYGEELSKEHGHNFSFLLMVEVFHNEREIEFLEFRDEIEEFVRTLPPFSILIPRAPVVRTPSSMSCESMGTKIMEYVFKHYPKREIKVSVFEDEFNGATVHWKGI